MYSIALLFYSTQHSIFHLLFSFRKEEEEPSAATTLFRGLFSTCNIRPTTDEQLMIESEMMREDDLTGLVAFNSGSWGNGTAARPRQNDADDRYLPVFWPHKLIGGNWGSQSRFNKCRKWDVKTWHFDSVDHEKKNAFLKKVIRISTQLRTLITFKTTFS